ncbi:alpha/beta hydrolase fold domain-containing protein [Planococcus sp. APC 4015]|nr:alpha/beta hydrolase fold domain-containing protein [Planococcus sp. APC 4015]
MTEPYAAAAGLVRVYPAREPNGTGLVWAHGGGFAFGDLDMPEADGVAHALATAGTTVVSVDYRLAPVTAAFGVSLDAPERAGVHYPAPSDDILTAWAWVSQNADRLRIDVSRLAIGGASAGANLVTGATLRLVASGDALPALVVLAYPTLLAVQPAPDAALRAALDANPAADRFPPAAIRAMYENYLGGSIEGAPLPAIPGLASADDLAGFPPTLMINGDADELRVSGEAFAATLAAAGRPVELRVEAGTEHGHLNRPGPAASASLDLIAARLVALPSLTPAPQSRSADAASTHSHLATAEPHRASGAVTEGTPS